MKGIFFLDNYLYGGDIKYFVELIKPFLKKNDIYIFCNEFDIYSEKAFEKIKNNSKIFFNKRNKLNNYLVDKKDNIFVKIIQKLLYILLPFRIFFYFVNYSILLKKIKPNFVISMNGGYPGSLKCISIILAAKFLDISNYLIVASKPPKRSIKTFYDFFLDFLVKISTKLIVINSKNQFDLFKKLRFFNKEKLLQVNNSIIINTKKFKKLNFYKKNIFLGVVSRLDKQKKIDKLIQLIKLLENNKKNFFLNIIGDGSDKNRLVSLTRELNLKKNINFRGFIENDKISKYLKELDIFVFPSEDEGLPFSILEAVNHGLPIVAADSGGISENFKNSKEMYILKNTSLKKYAEAIYKFINNPNLAQKMRTKSFSKLKKFYDLRKNQNILINKITEKK